MGAQQLPVDPGTDVEALCEAGADQSTEIAVAGLVLTEQNQMRIVVVDAVLFLETGARSDIDFTAYDGTDTLPDAGAVKRHGTVHDTMVSDSNGILAERLCLLCNLVNAAEAIQQGIFGMDMEVNETHVGSSAARRMILFRR